MSTRRAAIPESRLPAYDRAVAGAGEVYAIASRERARLAATQGLRAVAEAAWHPDHAFPTVEAFHAELERRYPAQARAA